MDFDRYHLRKEKWNFPVSSEITDAMRKVLEFDLLNYRRCYPTKYSRYEAYRTWEKTLPKKTSRKRESEDEKLSAKNLKLAEPNVDAEGYQKTPHHRKFDRLTDELISFEMITPHWVSEERSVCFLDREADKDAIPRIRTWIFMKVDPWRGVMMDNSPKDSGSPRKESWMGRARMGFRIDELVDAIENEFDPVSGAPKPSQHADRRKSAALEPIVLKGLYRLLSSEWNLLAMIESQSHEQVSDFITDYLRACYPELAEFRTATNIYYRADWEAGQALSKPVYKFGAKPSRELARSVLNHFVKNHAKCNKPDTAVAKEVVHNGTPISETSLKNAREALIKINCYHRYLVDPYLAWYALRGGQWPIRYFIFVKMTKVSPYERDVFEQDLRTSFFFNKGVNRHGMVLLEAKSLLSFPYNLVLSLLAPHEDATADFIGKVLQGHGVDEVTAKIHKKYRIEGSHTVISLVRPYFKDIRTQFEDRWKAESGGQDDERRKAG